MKTENDRLLFRTVVLLCHFEFLLRVDKQGEGVNIKSLMSTFVNDILNADIRILEQGRLLLLIIRNKY